MCWIGLDGTNGVVGYNYNQWYDSAEITPNDGEFVVVITIGCYPNATYSGFYRKELNCLQYQLGFYGTDPNILPDYAIHKLYTLGGNTPEYRLKYKWMAIKGKK